MTHKKADKSDAYLPFDISMKLAEGFVPDEAKKVALTKANEHLAKGDKAHAIEALKLGNIDVAVSAALIPAASSLQHVNDAVKLLSEKKYYEANLALKAVEDSVLVETYDINAVPKQGSAVNGWWQNPHGKLDRDARSDDGELSSGPSLKERQIVKIKTYSWRVRGQ